MNFFVCLFVFEIAVQGDPGERSFKDSVSVLIYISSNQAESLMHQRMDEIKFRLINLVKNRYRGFDELEGIEVAWNQVRLCDMLQSPEGAERLCCEIHLLRMLHHPNIIDFHASWVDGPRRNLNFVTEMFTSGTLRQSVLLFLSFIRSVPFHSLTELN